MKKILVTYNMFREGFNELENKYQVHFPTNQNFTYNEILEKIHEYDALCPMFNFPVTQELIDKGLNLQIIANYAVGYDNIDVIHAKDKGIVVTNTPDPVINPTANLALLLLLDTARRVSEYDRKLRTGRIKINVSENLGLPVTGKTLGIIGMGRIGKALCKRARACGMEVLYHNRHQLDLNEETKWGAIYVTKDQLLEQADFVSLNAPYTSETHHIISEPELKRMKKTAILINTARGALVDENALIKALQEKEIYGAGLDVFEFDDYPSNELLQMDNVVLTPHIGTQTTLTRIEMAKAVCNNIIGFFENDRPITRIY
ncbi:MAG: NAD(P)-binding domain-containing protein [Tannerella sp.]|jgi:lactate dehydrogenase-like 2-hydroxyacid dehydrogenase|nr:NAD(P)-binding domain-containing protein [Tannerella sp.]